MQRGAASALLLVGIGAIIVLLGAYVAFSGDEPTEPIEPLQAATAEDDMPAGTKNVRKTRSFVVLDNNFAYAGGNIYYRSGRATDGEPLYSVMPVAKPEDFKKVGTAEANVSQANSFVIGGGGGGTYAQSSYQGYTSSGGSDGSADEALDSGSAGTQALGSAGGGGEQEYSVSYYTDGENVYVVVETEGGTSDPQVVVGADPETFEVINAEYASDDDNVYVVTVTCIGDECNATVSIVASADPDTFQVYPNDQNLVNADCTGYVTADSQDANHVYNNGEIVPGVSVYLIGQGGECDNTPILISP